MKKIKSILVLSMFCVLFSCSDDDNKNNSNTKDMFTFAGVDYMIADGKSVNNHLLMSDTHTQYSFAMSDSEMTPVLNGSEPARFQTAGSLLHLRAYSEGENFKTGTYTLGCCDERYFTLSFITDEDIHAAEEGTVVISGNAPNYTIEFKGIMLSNGGQPLMPLADFTYNDGFEHTDRD